MPGVLGTVATAPEPRVCEWCSGGGWEPFEEGVPCLQCEGTGWRPCVFTLPATRSRKHRSARFDPNTRMLTITQDKDVDTYAVREIGAHPSFGRGFELAKEVGGEVHHATIGREGMTCDCPGKSYEAAAKANERAWHANEPMVGGCGCKHLDCLLPLLAAGWLDLNRELARVASV